MKTISYDKLEAEDKKLDWRLTIKYREALLFQDLICQGLTNVKNFLEGVNLNFAFTNRKYADTYIYMDSNELDLLESLINEQYTKDKDYFSYVFEQTKKFTKMLIDSSFEIKKMQLGDKSKEELGDMFNDYFKVRKS